MTVGAYICFLLAFLEQIGQETEYEPHSIDSTRDTDSVARMQRREMILDLFHWNAKSIIVIAIPVFDQIESANIIRQS